MTNMANFAELKLQDQSLNQILISSLNVELVYVVLKSISSFSREALKITNKDVSGLLILTAEETEVFQEIDFDLEIDEEDFMNLVRVECQKKRIQRLEQIEIRLKDEF